MTANGKQVTKATTLDLAGTGLVENMITSLQQRLDPFGVTTSLMNAQSAWQLHPVEMSRALRAIAQDALTLVVPIKLLCSHQLSQLQRMAGEKIPTILTWFKGHDRSEWTSPRLDP